MTKEQGVLDLLIEVRTFIKQAYFAYDKGDMEEFKLCMKDALGSLLWAYG